MSLLHTVYRHKTRWLQILPSLTAEIQKWSYMYISAIIQRSGKIHPDRAEVWIEAQYIRIAVQSWTGYVSYCLAPLTQTYQSQTVSSSKAPSLSILPHARQPHSGRNHSPQRGIGGLHFTAFVTSWPVQDVIRIKAIHFTFIQLNFLRSTINYCKAYKDI